ncbi:MAG: ABC transporter ATP-binding protein [Alphaproteobacteria bacterium]
MLEVNDLAAGYGRTQVLWGVSLRLDAGERVGLFGPNGHGKSTLLKTISGLLKPWRGSILLEGKEIGGIAPRAVVDLGLIHVPQGNVLFPQLTVMENLRLGAYCKRARDGQAENLARVLELFPRLAERRRQLSRTLSGGERQMLAIGVGLMGAPSLLMLDEPTLGLAPKLKDELLEAIGKISRAGVPLVLVEQDVEFLVALTDRLYMINHGAVALDVASTDRLDHAEIMQMYFGEH